MLLNKGNMFVPRFALSPIHSPTSPSNTPLWVASHALIAAFLVETHGDLFNNMGWSNHWKRVNQCFMTCLDLLLTSHLIRLAILKKPMWCSFQSLSTSTCNWQLWTCINLLHLLPSFAPFSSPPVMSAGCHGRPSWMIFLDGIFLGHCCHFRVTWEGPIQLGFAWEGWLGKNIFSDISCKLISWRCSPGKKELKESHPWTNPCQD